MEKVCRDGLVGMTWEEMGETKLKSEYIVWRFIVKEMLIGYIKIS